MPWTGPDLDGGCPPGVNACWRAGPLAPRPLDTPSLPVGPSRGNASFVPPGHPRSCRERIGLLGSGGVWCSSSASRGVPGRTIRRRPRRAPCRPPGWAPLMAGSRCRCAPVAAAPSGVGAARRCHCTEARWPGAARLHRPAGRSHASPRPVPPFTRPASDPWIGPDLGPRISVTYRWGSGSVGFRVSGPDSALSPPVHHCPGR